VRGRGIEIALDIHTIWRTTMHAPIDFLSDPAPRDIGSATYDGVRRLFAESMAEPSPWDDEVTKPGNDD
jgi:hypothetical protein